MTKTHFKRHGFGEWLELQGLPDAFYIQLHNKSTSYSYHLDMEIRIEGRCVKSKEVNFPSAPQYDYKSIQREITKFVGFPVSAEPFIESYYPSGQYSDIPHLSHPEDRDIVRGVDVTGKTAGEVCTATNINLADYFKDWNIGENISDVLRHPPRWVYDIPFVKLYQIIHEPNNRNDREKLFFAEQDNAAVNGDDNDILPDDMVVDGLDYDEENERMVSEADEEDMEI